MFSICKYKYIENINNSNIKHGKLYLRIMIDMLYIYYPINFLKKLLLFFLSLIFA